MDRIVNMPAIRTNFGGEEVILHRIYDNIHIFDWLGHSILKIVNEQGFLQWHTTQEQGLRIAEASGIIPVYRESIEPTEHEGYLSFVASCAMNDFEVEFGGGTGDDTTL